jgi:membrane dipeptidase
MSEPPSIHDDAVVIDATCPLLYDLGRFREYQRGGVTVACPTVLPDGGPAGTLKRLGAWHRLIREEKSLMLVRTVADIAEAKKSGRMGIMLHFQGADPIENDVDYIDAYKALGVGMIQLTYNVKNRLGDGCEERTDAGLSRFGIAAIRRMNEAGVVVDVSHTGYRTTMEAMEASTRPVVFSHACSQAVYDSQRNIRDDQIKAAAATGGLVGVAAVPFFISPEKRPGMEHFLAHLRYMVDLVGPDHVALGLDYYTGQHPYANEEAAMAAYRANTSSGRWTASNYPPPPYYYPEGMETPDRLANLTQALSRDGFSDAEVRKIIGENWVRVFRDVWGGQAPSNT